MRQKSIKAWQTALVSLVFAGMCINPGLAQEKADYYAGITGSGYVLKTNLHNLINGHTSVSYSALWTHMQSTDNDGVYENDNTVLDVYSENPSGADSYNFSWGSDQCGTYSAEGGCYNREHSMPASWFDDRTPMYTDLFHLYPTDGYVNNRRSSYPFGEVASPTWTSNNGSKLGPCSYPGYSGTVFEPINEFKGDFARSYFYMATRYEDVISGWTYSTYGNAILNETSDQVFENWYLNMMIEWHQSDPVSQKELDRNEAIQAIQGNRNPFIDHPEYVCQIWSGFCGASLSLSESSLTGFSYYEGNGPSSQQSFILSGSELDGSQVVISAPTNYEVSLSSGSGYAASINVNYSGGTLSATTIYVRLKAGLPAGTYNNETVICNDNGTAPDVTLLASGDVLAATPTLEVSLATLSGFSYTEESGPSASQSFTLSGIFLDGSEVSINAPSNYEISLDNSSFSASKSITYSAPTLSATTVYVRLKSGLVSGNYNNENVICSDNGSASDVSVSNNGSVSAPSIFCDDFEDNLNDWTVTHDADPGASVIVSSSWSGAGATSNAALFNAALTGGTTETYVSTIEKTFTNVKNVSVNFWYYFEDYRGGELTVYLNNVEQYAIYTDGTGDLAIDANTDDTWIEISLDLASVSSTVDDYTLKIEGTSKCASSWQDRVAIDELCIYASSGTPTPTLNVSNSTFTGYTYNEGSGPSASQNFSISGSNLDGTQVSVSAPVNYEISLDNSSFSASLNIAYTAPTLSGSTVYVRLKSGLSAGTYNNENVTCSDNGSASDVIVANSGEVIAVSPELVLSTASLTGYSYIEGNGPSASQSFSLSGTHLDGTQVTLTAPTNYEISLNNSTFASSQLISYTAPTLSGTSVYVRLKSGLTLGTYNNENVSCSDNGSAADVSVSNSGSVLSASSCEDFENFNESSYYSGIVTLESGDWNFTSVYKEPLAHGGSVACRINDGVAGANITSPSFNTVGTVTFWCRPLNDESSSFNLQKSVDGGSFETIDTYTYGASTSFTKYSFDVNEGSSDVKIRILNDNQIAHLIIDDFCVTSYSPPAYCTDLLISEYVEADFENKAIELFNGTGATINLSNYELKQDNGSDGTWDYSLSLSGTLAHGEVFVIANSNGADLIADIGSKCNLPSASEVLTFNGDDKIGLFKNDGLKAINLIDVVGDGTNYNDQSLARNGTIMNPSITFNIADWTQTDPFTYSNLGQTDNPLPVTWGSFILGAKADAIELQWSTASETNNDYFELLKSNNGIDYNAIGFVDGAGNSQSKKYYSFVDNDPLGGLNYYQIKQVDFNGDSDYSKVEVIDWKAVSGSNIEIKAMLENNSIKILINYISNQAVIIELFSIDGKLIKRTTDILHSKHQWIQIDDILLNKGMYLLRVLCNDQVASKKIMSSLKN